MTQDNRIAITRSSLDQLCAHYKTSSSSKQRIRNEYLDAIVDMVDDFDRYRVSHSPSRLCHFLAQISHECGVFTVDEESLFYTTPSRIMAVWPSRFKTKGQALPYIRRPEALANKVYGKRMGNQHYKNGGWDYRGRGAMQTTGASGYAKLGETLNKDLISNPDLLIKDKKLAILAALEEWKEISGNHLADRGDIRQITRRINGGYNGFEDRKKWFTRAWLIWGKAAPMGSEDNPNTLGPGDTGSRVRALQERLHELKYPCGKADGAFGDLTKDAVILFQAHQGIAPDMGVGFVDDNTWQALENADTAPRQLGEREDDGAEELEERGSQIMLIFKWLKRIGALLGLTAAGDGMAKASAIGDIQKWAEYLTALKPAIDTLLGFASWAVSDWWIAGGLLAFAIYWLSTSGQKARVEDHKSGKNLGR